MASFAKFFDVKREDKSAKGFCVDRNRYRQEEAGLILGLSSNAMKDRQKGEVLVVGSR